MILVGIGPTTRLFRADRSANELQDRLLTCCLILFECLVQVGGLSLEMT